MVDGGISVIQTLDDCWMTAERTGSEICIMLVFESLTPLYRQ
jgi:hypothetical protein